MGSVLMFTGYPAFLFFKRENLQLRRSLWVLVYLIGIVVISILGDKHFEMNNFTPYKPLGILPMPYDLVVLGLFSILIFAWAYKENIRAIYAPKK